MPINVAWARTFTIAGAIVVIAAGAFVATFWNYAGHKTIIAGKIEIEDGPPVGSAQVPLTVRMRASFTVYTPTLRFDAIPSQGTGGACLVADLNPDLPTGVPPGGCTTNAQCGGSLPTGWSGYCDKSQNKCWVRPGAPQGLCNRSIDVPPGAAPIIWQDGVKNPVPQNPPAILPLPGAETEWRVLACLNHFPPSVPPVACGTHLEVFGTPKKTKVRPRLP